MTLNIEIQHNNKSSPKGDSEGRKEKEGEGEG
jgi:hypothetical protein